MLETEVVSPKPLRKGGALKLILTVLVAGLVATVAIVLAASTLPGLVGLTPVVVLSGSMEPALRVGDIAVTRWVDPATVGVGDVVTYRSGSHFVTHRIIRVADTPQGRLFEFKGDNNPTPDSKLVAPEQVVARLVYGVPKMGYLVAFANSPNGLALFIVTPAVILAMMWYRERQEKKARSQQSPTPELHKKGDER